MSSKVRDGKDEPHLADVLARMTLKALNEKGFHEGRESQTFAFKDQGLQSINPQVQFQGAYIVRKDWVPTKTS
jgi:hypothetical protein